MQQDLSERVQRLEREVETLRSMIVRLCQAQHCLKQALDLMATLPPDERTWQVRH